MGRTLVWFAAAGALAAAASGCGASLDPVAKAAAATDKLGSAKVTISATASVPGSPTPVVMNGSGAFSPEGGTMALDMAAQGQTQHLDEIFLRNGGQPLVYLRSSLFGGQLPAGKSWVRVDVAAAAKRQGLDFGSLTNPTGGSPADAVSMLRQTSGDVRKVGVETIDGAPATHYSATIDLKRVAAANPAAKQAVDRLVKLVGRATEPVDVWVDDQGRVRRERFSLQVPSQGGNATVTTTMTLFDYGAPVTVTAPPPAEVVDAPA